MFYMDGGNKDDVDGNRKVEKDKSMKRGHKAHSVCPAKDDRRQQFLLELTLKTASDSAYYFLPCCVFNTKMYKSTIYVALYSCWLDHFLYSIWMGVKIRPD
jgi:hypothetical protein